MLSATKIPSNFSRKISFDLKPALSRRVEYYEKNIPIHNCNRSRYPSRHLGDIRTLVATRAHVAFRLQRIRVVTGSKKTPFRGGWTGVAKTEAEHTRTARRLRVRVPGGQAHLSAVDGMGNRRAVVLSISRNRLTPQQRRRTAVAKSDGSAGN